MHATLRRTAALSLAGALACMAQTVVKRPIGDCRLAFEDDFDGAALDTSRWHYRTDSKHWSTQMPANVSMADGMLNLAVKKQNAGGKAYTGSGVISKREFRYGYFESRFKIPAGKGWHTSFWVMKYAGLGGTETPAAFQEIDICENDSKSPTHYATNLHNWNGTHTSHGGQSHATPDLRQDFHVWGCDFSPSEVQFYFDGKHVRTLDARAQKHGDAAIWLTTIASHLGGTDTVDDATLPSAAVFDYVRFYELIDPVFPDTVRTDTLVRPDPSRPALVVDNGDSGFTVNAPWTASTFTAGYQGADYLTDGSPEADPGRWARWAPDLPEEGRYRLFMRWTSGANRPARAPVEIEHAEGTTFLAVDQTLNNGTWVFLGDFLMQKGNSGYVKLSGSAPGHTVADAVRFERIPTTGAGRRAWRSQPQPGAGTRLRYDASGRDAAARAPFPAGSWPEVLFGLP